MCSEDHGSWVYREAMYSLLGGREGHIYQGGTPPTYPGGLYAPRYPTFSQRMALRRASLSTFPQRMALRRASLYTSLTTRVYLPYPPPGYTSLPTPRVYTTGTTPGIHHWYHPGYTPLVPHWVCLSPPYGTPWVYLSTPYGTPWYTPCWYTLVYTTVGTREA